MMSNGIIIRALIALPDMLPIEQLQEEIWGYGSSKGSPYPYPARCLFELSESGGLVAGAFDGIQMVGFAAAWIGKDKIDDQLYLHSQLVGIRNYYRNQGLGYRLKMFQKDFALQSGLSLIKWTFDPLQPRNAYLNLHKLKAIVRTFIPNYYGILGGKLSEDMPTDRFWAEWHIRHHSNTSPPQADDKLQDIQSIRIINPIAGDKDRPYIADIDLSLEDEELLVVLPNNIQDVRQSHPATALDWQMKFRQIFQYYFPTYHAIDFIKAEGQSFYLLKRQNLLMIRQL